jgi:hypothetical protein
MGLKLFNLPQNDHWIVLGVILLLIVVVRGAQFFLSRSKTPNHLPPGAARKYGVFGGAICPNCHRPFSLGMMPINISFGTKLARCQFCGKWSFVRRASPEALRAAEAAELADAQSAPHSEKSAADRTKELVDDSRFTDQT